MCLLDSDSSFSRASETVILIGEAAEVERSFARNTLREKVWGRPPFQPGTHCSTRALATAGAALRTRQSSGGAGAEAGTTWRVRESRDQGEAEGFLVGVSQGRVG